MQRKLIFCFMLLCMNLVGYAQLSSANKNALKKELAKQVNELRASKGVKPLLFNSVLKKAAENQSGYMAVTNELSHGQHTPKSATPRKRVLKYNGKDFEIVGENILFVAAPKLPLRQKAVLQTATEMFQAWKTSPGHYANMIDPEYEFGDFGFKIGRDKDRIYATQVFGKKGIKVGGQLSDNAFGLTADPDECMDAFGNFSNVVANMGNAVNIEGDQLTFYYHDIHYFNKILSSDNDGLAVDLIVKDQVACGKPNQLDYSPVYDGVLLKPVYKKEILANNTAESEYRIISKIGTIPEALKGRDISPTLVLIKNGRKCKALIPGDVPRKAYALRPIEPLLYDPANVELINKGIIQSQELIYDFETNITEPIRYPEIENFPLAVHSLEIVSYSSVEGNAQKNRKLHKQRAQNIKKHLLKHIKIQQSAIKVSAKENWDKMFFQLQYHFQDELTAWPKDSLKNLLAGNDDRLPWDSLLRAQRQSLATINYIGTLPDSFSFEEKIALNLKMAVSTKNYELANKAMYELYQSEDKASEILFDRSIFAALKGQPELVQNAAALLSHFYKYDLNKTVAFLNAWATRKEDLSKEALKNILHLYTLTSLQLLQDWDVPAKSLSNVIHPNKINVLTNDNTKHELILNLHLTFIRYFGQINDGVNISKSFNFITEYFKSRTLKIEDELALVLFFNRWSMYDMTNRLLLSKFDGDQLNEDALFILLKTLSFYNGEEHDLEEIHQKAIELNPDRWCKWLNKNFQILRDHKIKRLFCETCQ